MNPDQNETKTAEAQLQQQSEQMTNQKNEVKAPQTPLEQDAHKSGNESDDSETDHSTVRQYKTSNQAPKEIPTLAKESVLVKSNDSIVDKSHVVKGYDFNDGVNHKALLESYLCTGFQATHFGQACEEVNQMLKWRLSDEPVNPDDDEEFFDEDVRKNTKCTIFLGYTSNMISAGTRESIRFLAEHKMVDVMVSSAGGIEEDFMKCMADTYVGAFDVNGEWLRKNGINRIGNLLVPNDNYCMLEDWLMPILDKMLEEQREHGIVWSPSKLIHRLGKEINDPRSVYYWAYKNDIPVFCPAITDGAIGDVIYFHSYKNPGLILDIAQDVRHINRKAVHAKKSGVILLGGGVIKHHILNANLMRNGADFSVFVNTGNEFDGSDSGARPEEAKSWGKIRANCNAVKVHADASFIFPLLVSQTFAPYHFEQKKKAEQEG
mmetsp:Transcript_3502/g.13386  ORF Transcript_3502/g.13386 Transcript_3502/m.13386 type:complete len:434 (-) Transcript_3502:56-1357(-)|eukprot:CAMPEP_0117447608 /NCGR_PEP_ID=MMETSP0759-20121206/6966_1 /TAXON_ID=63605 /ORGANISM="Percolomonas cosmopolitus, Strain WS" /LENGTH=433 /DNA_ID=CAMNT_0005239955 /DNA_START=124 /DNA_END=1425 /DNA_ORIENTATION=+